MPIGKRPVPRVATGRTGNKWSGPDVSRNPPGTRSSGSPMGSRPTPRVAGGGGPGIHAPKPPGNRRATRNTPMPASKRAATTGRSRRYGG